ncbi:MAG: 50S ribosomal protein L11 methyltransferase [Flavobacteriales bacterium]|nr:50S ribosomal protein L11 methyltransferase [Flavobacteriales bacterium]
MNYIELDFILEPLMPARDVLVAELADAGFDSFVETDDGVKAYIPEENFTDDIMKDMMVMKMPELSISYVKSMIEDQNWNAEWEKSFDPIDVEGKCLIRAPFHDASASHLYEIIIEPKMSFGTGHHATTYLMIAEMMDMDLNGKTVLDMGCGTGVLAVMAEKQQASDIDAIDIDEWAFENTLENVERNHCHHIQTIKGGAEAIPSQKRYDVILANINRNILTRDMHVYVNAMNTSSHILFSGFFVTDRRDIETVATSLGLQFVHQRERGEWTLLHFRKEQ